jgi:hypothetical protein
MRLNWVAVLDNLACRRAMEHKLAPHAKFLG